MTVDRVDLKEVRQIGFVNAEDISRRILDLFEAGEFDVCTMYFSEFKSVISQIPTPLQLIPAKAARRRRRRRYAAAGAEQCRRCLRL